MIQVVHARQREPALDIGLLESHVARMRELDDEIAGCADEAQLGKLRVFRRAALLIIETTARGERRREEWDRRTDLRLAGVARGQTDAGRAIKDLQVTQRQSSSLRERQHCEGEIAILRLRIAEADAEIAEAERERELLASNEPV